MTAIFKQFCPKPQAPERLPHPPFTATAPKLFSLFLKDFGKSHVLLLATDSGALGQVSLAVVRRVAGRQPFRIHRPKIGRSLSTSAKVLGRCGRQECSWQITVENVTNCRWFDQKVNTTLYTNLRLRLLSSTKLVILLTGHESRHAPDGRARNRSCEGIPVPVEGRE